MKKVVLFHLLPVLFCIAGLLFFYHDLNSIFFKKTSPKEIDKSLSLIGNFTTHPEYEDLFLTTGDSSEKIWMLGSSELGVNTDATPYNFINNNFKTRLTAVGHAGNQSLSIYSMLLANVSKLRNAPIIILVSPGWFNSKSAAGTSAQIFLEFNSTPFLDNIVFNDSDKAFRQYEAKRVSELFDELSNPSLALKAMYFENYSERNVISQILSYPVMSYYRLMLSSREKYFYNKDDSEQGSEHHQFVLEDKKINWDSLYKASSKEHLENCLNNNWGIDSEYYYMYVKGSPSKVSIVSNANNKELEDFKMLVKLLREKNTNASFVIQPINPYYYKNAPELNGVISEIASEISTNKFPCLNLWNSDSTTFDKCLLKDVMHLSSYGWYKIDKFIVDTYKFSK